jgi:hypothetical protein
VASNGCRTPSQLSDDAIKSNQHGFLNEQAVIKLRAGPAGFLPDTSRSTGGGGSQGVNWDRVALTTFLDRVQRLLGDHFAPAQSGSRWTSPTVARLMQWCQASQGDGAAVGQSSWGPTGFAIVPSAAAARGLVEAAQAAGVVDAALTLRVVAGRNHGAVVDPHWER